MKTVSTANGNSNGVASRAKAGFTEDVVTPDSLQCVTFMIGEETYGVDVLKVHEIIGMARITSIPNMERFMKGVINLRGSVVPVVDMRARFSMAQKEYDRFTVIIIAEVSEKLVGMIVDSVADVVVLPAARIQDTPNFSSRIDVEFIRGIGQVDDTLIILLDVDRILSADELDKIESGMRK